VSLFRWVSALPVVNRPFGNITVSFCSFIKRTVLLDSYSDSDAGELELQLLDSSKGVLAPQYPFINFEASNRTVYVVPIPFRGAITNARYAFYMRVKNRITTKFVDDEFWLVLTGAEDIPEKNVGFQLENRILLPQQTSEINLLYRYLEKVLNYFDTPLSSKVIQVYQYTFLVDGRLNIYYQNCTLREDPCDDGANKRIYEKLNGTIYEPATFAIFPNYMKPEFAVTSTTKKEFGPCKLPNNMAIFDSAQFADAMFFAKDSPWWLRVSPYPGIYTFDYEQVFSHEQQSFLRYEILFGGYDPVPSTYYAYFKTDYTAKTNTLYLQVSFFYLFTF
jgi:hypothetical protein